MNSTDGTVLAVEPLVQGLTAPQRDAVLHTEGPLLVLAAAGSGKTRVITRRIGYLIACGIPAWSILALTFTNKAAGEMRSRVLSLLGDDPARTRALTVTTFHSLCARLLRRYADLAGVPGLKADFSIYDTADQAAVIKKVIAALGLNPSNWPPRSVLSAISNSKNDLIDAAAFEARAGDFYSRTVARIYHAYDRALRAANAVDFDDLLVLTARLLKTSERARRECSSRWQYLLIDEYQDTNRAQFQIASLLAAQEGGAGGPNICVVGDPDQSIYGWRGADITNILDFERQYPGARVIALGENFRSTSHILGTADTLIRHNRLRKHKDLFTSRAGGEKVHIALTRDEQHEAHLVVDWLKGLHGTGNAAGADAVAWRDMAVFYRTNSLSRVIEDALRAAGIPYIIARGTAFYQREEVKNALAYLRLLANPADDVSLARVVNTPTRGIGDATLALVEAHAASAGLPIMRALAEADRIPGLTARARSAISRFTQMFDAWTGRGSLYGGEARAGGSLAELVSRVIRESGLEEMYQAQARASKSEADAERTDNLDELVSSAREFELEYDPVGDPASPRSDRDDPAAPAMLPLLRAYLESVSLIADADAADPAQGAVTLMTLHAAKGLEFPAVAMIGLEEGLLPHARARESDAALEEERRLCFVGITRAMRHLHISCSRYRTVRGMSERTIPSRFLDEIGPEHTVLSDRADLLEGADDLDERPAWGEGRARGRAGRSGEWPAGAPRAGVGALFPIGATVRHPQFGVGRIISITTGSNARAQIKFRDVGTKTLVLEYARLERA